MKYIITGPPGSGKGTLAKQIAKKFNLHHISAGDLLRERAKQDDELGKSIASLINNGNFVSDDLIKKIIEEEVQKNPNFILDGFPRTFSQAKVLDEMLNSLGNKLDLVLYFAISEESIVLRLSGRRICSVCGANYHIVYVPSSKEGICDKCGGILNQRADDKPDTVLARLRVYREQTEDLIAYYKKNGILKEIKSDTSITVVKESLLNAINYLGKKKSMVLE